MADALFKPYADRLLACLCAQWPDDDPLKPAKCCFRFDDSEPTMGIAINEDECKCGVAWVRVVDWFITSETSFPGEDTSMEAQRCPRLWGLVLEMGTGRCPPQGDARNLPTCEQMNAFHEVMLDDGRRFRNAIYCCFLTVDPLDQVSIGSPTRIGPQGLCMQQTLTLTIMVGACDECP
jgi:hypothetical protein